jgi:hypothetical protein
MADPNRPARRTDQLNVRNRNPALLLGDAALDIPLRVRAHVLFDDHHVLDKDFCVIWKNAEHASFLALVSPGDHLHSVIAPDVYSLVCCRCYSHMKSKFQTFKVSMLLDSQSSRNSKHLETLKR